MAKMRKNSVLSFECGHALHLHKRRSFNEETNMIYRVGIMSATSKNWVQSAEGWLEPGGVKEKSSKYCKIWTAEFNCKRVLIFLFNFSEVCNLQNEKIQGLLSPPTVIKNRRASLPSTARGRVLGTEVKGGQFATSDNLAADGPSCFPCCCLHTARRLPRQLVVWEFRILRHSTLLSLRS